MLFNMENADIFTLMSILFQDLVIKCVKLNKHC